jgi:hypothetical protein
MKHPVSVLSIVLAVGMIATAAFAQLPQLPPPDDFQATVRYLPQYTSDGDLILPKNFHAWIYVGSPLTPNALNNGKANFPEFHNVYIEPGSQAQRRAESINRSFPGPPQSGPAIQQEIRI